MKLKTKSIEKISKIKNWFFEKINKIDKALAKLTKKKERRHKLLILEMKDITTGCMGIKMTIKEYY